MAGSAQLTTATCAEYNFVLGLLVLTSVFLIIMLLHLVPFQHTFLIQLLKAGVGGWMSLGDRTTD